MLTTFAQDLERWRPIQADALRGQRRKGWQAGLALQRRGQASWTISTVIDAVKRWAAAHGGLPPRRSDWTPANDPLAQWPRVETVRALFEPLAFRAGVRRIIHCSCPCHQPLGMVEVEAADGGTAWRMGRTEIGCACDHRCNEVVGMSGWAYALHLAGFEVRGTKDHVATAAQGEGLGRNRQMVTGRGHDERIPGSVKHRKDVP